jgi:prolipoprotein diacylglyceryltransferase
MGGLFGGLLGVEIAKKIIGEKTSSGDLFTFPIIVGVAIGRVGCLLMGVKEFTYGTETSFFTGMDLGDGLKRHPISLYEIIFLILLFLVLKKIKKLSLENGELFKFFMISYFGFMFIIEFLKPNVFYTMGLSSIQWLCIICFIYYYRTFVKYFVYAHKKLHLL